MDLDEAQLIKEAKTSSESFGRLFDLYYKKVFNFCLKRIGHIQTAEDLTTEIFLKVLQNINKYEDRGLPFGAWLFRIANNELCSYFRKSKFQTSSVEQLREEQGFDIPAEGNSSSMLISQELDQENFANLRLVNLALQKISEDYREVLSLRYFEKMQIKEIAEIVDKKEGTVKSLLSRGIEKLKTEMESANLILQPNTTTNVVINEDQI